MSGQMAWKTAFAMTGIVAAINAGILIVFIYLASVVEDPLAELPYGIWLLIFSFLMFFVLLANRFFLTLGIKTELKRPGVGPGQRW